MRIFTLLALFIALSLGSGCVSAGKAAKVSDPEIAIDETGIITFNDKQLKPGKIASALRSAGYERSQEINILVPDKRDRSVMRSVSADLVHGGYTHFFFVTQRKAVSTLAKPE
jgi:hypothetical protein